MAAIITFAIGTLFGLAGIMLEYTHPETDGFYGGLKLCCLLMWGLFWFIAPYAGEETTKD